MTNKYFNSLNGYIVEDQEAKTAIHTLETAITGEGGLDSRVDTLENDVETLEGNIQTLETAITGEGGLDSRVDTLENDVETAERNIQTLEGKTMYSDVENLAGTLNINNVSTPIYRKTIFVSEFPQAIPEGDSFAEVTYNTGIINMDKPINISGMYYDTASSYPGASFPINNPFEHTGTSRKVATRLRNDGTTITIWVDGPAVNAMKTYQGYVTIEYTKTN